jgi:hypothetical protein
MTVDEAHDIIRNRDHHDYGTVQRAMRVIEQDANQHWGPDDTRKALSRALTLTDGALGVRVVDLIQQLIREEIETALELERAHVK